MNIITAEQVHSSLTFDALISLLHKTFSNPFSMPQRQVFHLDESTQSNDAFALLPSWNDDVIGTKAFTYFPENKSPALHSLYSKIMLFKRKSGEPLALVDGTSVTYWRTAAVSALASQLLSNKTAKHLILFGTGNLSTYLIKAHLAVRPLSHITIVARRHEKGLDVIDAIAQQYPDVKFAVAQADESLIQSADIIVCATASPTPLFNGNWLSAGTHIDCLGNHNHDRRECDTITVKKSRVFVDSLTNTLAEAGELIIPMNEGTFSKSHIQGELADMCLRPAICRRDPTEITLFKSVGTAISDLVTAYYVYGQTQS